MQSEKNQQTTKDCLTVRGLGYAMTASIIASHFLSFYRCVKVNYYFIVQTKNGKQKVVQACAGIFWCHKTIKIQYWFHSFKI